jgi:hypothetical protein
MPLAARNSNAFVEKDERSFDAAKGRGAFRDKDGYVPHREENKDERTSPSTPEIEVVVALQKIFTAVTSDAVRLERAELL